MCNLCSNIINEKEIEKLNYWDRYGTIVHNLENNTYGIWIQHDNDYYSGVAIEINYCPECGRKLSGE